MYYYYFRRHVGVHDTGPGHFRLFPSAVCVIFSRPYDPASSRYELLSRKRLATIAMKLYARNGQNDVFGHYIIYILYNIISHLMDRFRRRFLFFFLLFFSSITRVFPFSRLRNGTFTVRNLTLLPFRRRTFS